MSVQEIPSVACHLVLKDVTTKEEECERQKLSEHSLIELPPPLLPNLMCFIIWPFHSKQSLHPGFTVAPLLPCPPTFVFPPFHMYPSNYVQTTLLFPKDHWKDGNVLCYHSSNDFLVVFPLLLSVCSFDSLGKQYIHCMAIVIHTCSRKLHSQLML